MSIYEEQDYNKKIDFSLWKKLIKYLKPYKKLLILLGVVMVVVAAIDVTFPIMNEYAINNFVVPGNLDGLLEFAILYGILIIILAFGVWALIAIAGKVETSLPFDIRKEGFERLQKLSLSYYDKTPIGWMMARITSDTRRLGEVISWGLVDFIWGTAMMTGIAIVMLIKNWKLALITLSVVPILAVVSVYFQQKILKSFREVRKTNSKITGAFNEGITGAKTTKTLVREEENLKEFQVLTGKMRNSSIRAAIFSSLFLPIVLNLASIGTGLALWVGGNDVIMGNNISYGTLVLFINYTTLFFEPVRQLARILAELQAAQASAERVMSMIETEPEIKDSEEVIKSFGTIYNPIKENWPPVKGDISFNNVTFAYKDGEKVLENFDLEVRSGETIALVGETGSGKSTIVNLACRFYEPTEGGILIDGIDYRERSLEWLHSNLGYVLQSPHLFSGTIKENIRYGYLEATEIEIIRAAKLVNAHNFISRLEKGYDTEVGEGGGKLSTGEKQLISFARAIVSNPSIFVLDEATSSIDTETEKLIQEAIDNVLKHRTSFIIAHRLSTIIAADRILVIQKGKIIEEGNHEYLLKQKGYYHRLYTNQFRKEIETKSFS